MRGLLTISKPASPPWAGHPGRGAPLALVLVLGLLAAALPDAAAQAAPARPARIVALAPSLVELVFALGEGQRLAGRTLYSDYPPEALSLPQVGSYYRPELERIVALRPDLCLAVTDGNPSAVLDRLSGLDIPVERFDFNSLADLRASLLRLGDLLDCPDKAHALVGAMDARLARLDTLARRGERAAGRRPSVLFQLQASPILAVNHGTFVGELIKRAGGDIRLKGDALYPRLSVEEVLALKPDIIIAAGMTTRDGAAHNPAQGSSGGPGPSTTPEAIEGFWRRYPQVPAVARGRVYIVSPDLFNRPSLRSLDALEALISIIYPDLDKDSAL